MGGAAFPYLWVPEWHPGGHGLHVHFLVGRYVKRALIREAWELAAQGAPGGRVDIRRLNDLPVGSGPLAAARLAALYAGKYVAKTFTDTTSRIRGLKRYDVAEGFRPKLVGLRGNSWVDVRSQAVALMGGQPARQWLSWVDADSWDGPPAGWFQWD